MLFDHHAASLALTRQQVHEPLAGLDRQPFAAREDHHPFVIIMGDESQQLLDPSHFLCYREFSPTSSLFLRLSTGVPSSRRLQSVQRLPPLFAIACSSSTTQSLPCTPQSPPPAIAVASASHVTDTCHLHCSFNGRALRHLLAGYV